MNRSSKIVLLVLLSMVFAVVNASARTEIEVWVSNFTADTQRFIDERMVPEFEAANPDLKVNVVYVRWTEFYDKLYATFAAGTAPDVFQGGSSFRGMAGEGFGMPITQYTENWEDKDDFFPGSWAAVHWKGEDYGIPTLTAPRTVIYRADMFAEMGIDPSALTMEWEEVRDIARRLSRVDSEGNVVRWGFRVPYGDVSFFQPLLWQAGGDYVTPDGNTPLFNTPEGWAAAEFNYEFYREQAANGPMPAGGLAAGAYAMEYNSTKVAADALRINSSLTPDDIRVASPMRNARQAGGVFTDSFFVSSQTKHPDEVWEFLKWFAKVENITEYNSTLSYIPPRRSSIQTDYVQGSYHVLSAIELVMPFGVVNPTSASGANTAVANALRNMVTQGWTAEQALATAEAGWVPFSN